MEAEDGEAGVIRLLQVVLGRVFAVDQIRVKNVELVALTITITIKRSVTAGSFGLVKKYTIKRRELRVTISREFAQKRACICVSPSRGFGCLTPSPP